MLLLGFNYINNLCISWVYISRGSGGGASLGAGNAWVIYHDANHYESNFIDPELNIRRLIRMLLV